MILTFTKKKKVIASSSLYTILVCESFRRNALFWDSREICISIYVEEISKHILESFISSS